MKNINVVQLLALSGALLMSQVSHADVEVSFRESAPKDSFMFKNSSQCDLVDVLIEVDLTDSAGRLIFDTTSTGAGVEVFQPFEVKQGNMSLSSSASVLDGDTTLAVQMEFIKAGETVSFTIDVDDTLAKSELGNIRVSGAEIEGGAVNISILGKPVSTAIFSNKAQALISLQDACAN